MRALAIVSDWEWYIENDGVVTTSCNDKDGPGHGCKEVGPGDSRELHKGGHSSEAMELSTSILLINGVRVEARDGYNTYGGLI